MPFIRCFLCLKRSNYPGMVGSPVPISTISSSPKSIHLRMLCKVLSSVYSHTGLSRSLADFQKKKRFVTNIYDQNFGIFTSQRINLMFIKRTNTPHYMREKRLKEKEDEGRFILHANNPACPV